YVGNKSYDLPNFQGAGSNINLLPAGAMLSAINPANANANDYRPIQGYSDINLATNNAYANYNALQVKFLHQSSRYTISANYTLGKALGTVSPNGYEIRSVQLTLDPFNLRNNYGVQPTDRRHIFNVAYSVDLGSPIHGNKFAAGAVNGWQISGITQLSSGANLTYSSGNDHFNMQLNNAIIPGSISAANLKGIQIG